MNHLVFAYGTLLTRHVQEAVIGRSIEGKPDRLRGFRKVNLQDGPDAFPNLVPDPEASIVGRILEVTPTELGHIDLYEGDLYARHRVTLESGTQAWIYYG